LRPGESVRLTFRYGGEIVPDQWRANLLTEDWFELAMYCGWYPLAPGDLTLTYEAEVRVPADYRVTGLGTVTRLEDDDGSARVRVVQATPVNDLVVAGSRALRTEVVDRPGQRIRLSHVELTADQVERIAADADDALQRFTRWFGPSRLDALEFLFAPREQGGGYARPGLVVMQIDAETDVAGAGFLRYLSHEVAHLWWRAAPTDSWQDWLNESFAEYSALMLLRERIGEHALEERIAEYREVAAATPPIRGIDRGHEKAFETLYRKGPVLLYELERRLGPDPFLAFLRALRDDDVRSTDRLLQTLARVATPADRDWLDAALELEGAPPPSGRGPRGAASPAAGAAVQVVEASIADLHAAMLAGRLTSRELVDAYLARIDAYDRRGPTLNALVMVNPAARTVADSLDAVLARTGELSGPLHGIPVIVKDNYDTRDLPTTAGSAVLAGSIPPDDAFQVRRLREAGAIVLAKSNMAEWAFSPYETVGSALPGHTFNPYALNRVPAGSSGGTAAAVAASFGAVGLGTDTGNSIRGPSSHTALVGIRPTLGLTSRDGIIPLYLDRDVGGPMARTVADAARLLDVIAGPDPADPVTLEAGDHLPESYTAFLDPDGLRGARIGVLRQISAEPTADPEIQARLDDAIAAMRAAGATVLDPVEIEGWDEIMDGPLFCRRFRHDINAYLASLGPDAPVRTLEEVIASGKAHPSVRDRLEQMASFPVEYTADETCEEVAVNAERLRAAVLATMDAAALDALLYPTWDNPPRVIGDLDSPDGNNSWQLSPPTGFPALTVPTGWVADGLLPAGLQLLGRPWSEPTLIRLAFAYEQATGHRRPPASTPPLPR
ncbi:MAG: amidase family protein, partial [Gemmatimonadota bacterium]